MYARRSPSDKAEYATMGNGLSVMASMATGETVAGAAATPIIEIVAKRVPLATLQRSCVVGATCPSFQASNAIVTWAVPTPAFSEARTGPWRLQLQHRCFNS